MRYVLSVTVLSLMLSACGESEKPQGEFGTAPDTPVVFLPVVVSKGDRYEFGSILNRDATEFYFGVQNDGWSDIRMMRRTADGWSNPEIVIGSTDFSTNDPFLSNDENRLFYISPKEGRYNIGYVTRTATGGWENPAFLPAPVNSDANEYYISIANDGAMVFASDRNATERRDFDIYMASRTGENYDTPSVFPRTINTDGYEADAFIAPDKSYLIFSSNRPGGFGRGDLYISFAEAGSWSQAVSMGDIINSEGHELCPFVTADGQYFFYTSREDIYWVDASIIETFRDS